MEVEAGREEETIEGRRSGREEGREELPLAQNQEISQLTPSPPLPSLYCPRGLVRGRQERTRREVRGGQAERRAGGRGKEAERREATSARPGGLSSSRGRNFIPVCLNVQNALRITADRANFSSGHSGGRRTQVLKSTGEKMDF